MTEPIAAIRVEDEGVVRTLTIDNPVRRNALDPRLLEQLRAVLDPGRSAGIRALVIRGAGDRAFCSGYDLQSLEAVGADGALPDDLIGEVFAALEAHPAPSVAVLNGPAFGAGFELATACDFRIGCSGARFCMPPAKLGVVYSPEGLQRLARLVGPSRAKLLFLSGRCVEADQALAWGLVDELRPTADEAFACARTLAVEIAQNAPLAVSGMKSIFTALGRGALSNQEQERFRVLRRAAFNSEDVQEGRQAFLEKRAPRFKGR